MLMIAGKLMRKYHTGCLQSISRTKAHTELDNQSQSVNSLIGKWRFCEVNAQDKKLVSSLYSQLEEIKSQLEDMQSAEQEKFDNMSEGLQQSERGQAIEEAANKLDDAVQELDNVLSNLDDVK